MRTPHDTDEVLERLSEADVLERLRAGTLPERWSMHFAPAGLISFGEELVLERGAPGAPAAGAQVGHAICVVSANRLAFRRVLDIRGHELRLRCDVAPFEDMWEGEVLARVRPRTIDRIAAVDPVRWTQANWLAAIGYERARAFRRKLKKRPTPPFRTELLAMSDWPRVRAFWLAACGTPLPSEAHAKQHVIGMFLGSELVGVNIHLVTGTTSYSAFTLVHPAYRGCGGGRMMIEHAVRLARTRGVERIYVHIDARNLASIAAYRAVGFHRAGWWSDDADPLEAAERQWRVFELVTASSGRADTSWR